MSGHLDGPPPGPPDPPYIPGDLGAPSAEEFARRRASPTPEERNPYAPSADWKPGQDTFTSQAAGIWAEGFAAGRAAATPDPPDAESLARMFHDSYEALAPSFGYITREASAVAWENVPADNKALMISTARAVLRKLSLRPASPDERLREALELIRAHARLDLTERGIAEAERYAVIADDALTGSDLLASSTAEKLASPRKHSASASDPMPLCDCEFCARPLRDHEEETR